MFALYLLLAVAGFTYAVPTVLRVADGIEQPRFDPLAAVAFFALTVGVAGIVAEQFDVRTTISLLAVVPLGIAGALLHFELLQSLARRMQRPLVEAAPQWSADDDIEP